MAIDERDPHTGHKTTGHEWNGIKELNTPVPKPVWFFLTVTGLFAIGYWILMPAWPTGASYTKGLLGVSDQQRVQAQREQSALGRADWLKQVEATSYEQLLADPVATERIRGEGGQLFGDAVCHGPTGTAARGRTSRTTTGCGRHPDTIAETIRVGVNSSHPTRVSEMIGFGAGGSSTRPGRQCDRLRAVAERPGAVNAGEAQLGACGARCSRPIACPATGPRGAATRLGVPNLTDHA